MMKGVKDDTRSCKGAKDILRVTRGDLTLNLKCPNCGEAELEQHRRRKDLLVCPRCWFKYDKQAALEGRFIRVKKKVKARWAHPR